MVRVCMGEQGVNLAGIFGGDAWPAPKAGYGEGCYFPSRLGLLGERRELPQRGPRQSPGRKCILRILKATERSFLYLYADALSNLVLEIFKHDKT